MSAERLLQPNDDRHLRWGYLDKFDVNPYLARSLALTTLVVCAATPAAFLLRGAPGPRVARVQLVEVVTTLPVPTIRVPSRTTQPVAAKRPAMGVKPVPAAPEPVEIEGASGTPGAQVAETTDAGPGDAAIARDAGVQPDAWPDPDAFIPVEQPPVLVAMAPPTYPEIARDAGIEGTVLVRALVGADGFVHRTLVLESVLGLDEAATSAAANAVFRAARQQGRPVAVWVVIPIEFRLRE